MIGPHIIGSVSRHFETLQRWQPRLILVLDPSPDQVRTLRQVCPNSFLVGRVFRPDHEVEQRIRANPIAAARWAHDAIMERFSPDIDAWQVENEVLQQWDGLPLLNQFAVERMRLADEHGYKAAILAFSVGNPDLPEHDRMAHWRVVGPALTYAEQHNHVVAVHQYGSPTLWQPDSNWYIHRLENQVLPLLPHSQVKFVCTEFGIDNMINGFHSGPSGWRNTISSAQQYAQDLINIGKHLERYKDRVLGYCVFTLGHNAPWQSYDIDGEVANLLATHYQANPQPRIEFGVPEPISEPVPAPVLPLQPPHPLQPPPPAVPIFRAGDIGQVAVLCRVRREPGLHGEILGLMEPGFSVCILDGPLPASNLLWWKVFGVKSGGERLFGWIAQQDPEGTQLLRKPALPLAGRLAAPFDGRFRLTQFFGEDPASYVGFGLRGHNGLDFGLPEGTPIKAVDAGWGFEVQNDPGGYGNYVKLQHTWGETVYAHLSTFAIQRGQQVSQGQVIGFSGKTGNVTGPHLHFAMRVNPYDRADGWLGYSDPLPWVPAHCYTLPFLPATEPEPGISPVVLPPVPPVERRFGPGFDAMRLKIQPITPAHHSDVVYVVKDVFTTQDGNWDMGVKPPPYGIVQWAREAYLKPWDASDVFDDAGGATHLFGAIIGLDERLMRNHTIRWWTTDNHHHFQMATKPGSGWANLFMNADSAFWPQDGQSGPWCWAPEGAIEAVIGGGLPNQWHVSTFVVWQAVRR